MLTWTGTLVLTVKKFSLITTKNDESVPVVGLVCNTELPAEITDHADGAKVWFSLWLHGRELSAIREAMPMDTEITGEWRVTAKESDDYEEGEYSSYEVRLINLVKKDVAIDKSADLF